MERVSAGLAPASDDELLDALISLEQSTQRRKAQADEVEEMKADRYVSKLRAYPRDIALFELAHWDDYPPPLGVYFPRWAELKQKLDERFAYRRRILPALQSIRPFEAAGSEAERDLASVEECNRIYRETMAKLGVQADPRITGRPEPMIAPAPNPFVDREPTLIERRAAETLARERAEIEARLHPAEGD